MSNSTNTTGSTYSPLSLLPPTTNAILLKGGDLALYNATLLLAANALFQHAAVFGLVFLLRGFSAKRALDLHFLTIIFAVSFIAAPLIFLIDTHIDSVKIWFFLEHEAIEFLIAIRVLAPKKFVRRHAGLIVFLCWTALSIVSIVVIFNSKHRHGADIIAWGAFASDSLISVAGATLIATWFRDREYGKRSGEKLSAPDKFRRRKEAAEAMAGLGFTAHGLSTVTVAPILDRVLYHDLNPQYFAYAWVAVFGFAFFTVALSVPIAAIFFSTINWYIWHDRKVLPGEAHWTGDDLENGSKPRREQRRTTLIRSISNSSKSPYSYSPRPQGTGVTHWTKLGEMHANSSLGPSIDDYERKKWPLFGSNLGQHTAEDYQNRFRPTQTSPSAGDLGQGRTIRGK